MVFGREGLKIKIVTLAIELWKKKHKEQNWCYTLWGTVKLTHLLWAELCPIKIHMLQPWPPKLQNVTTFANKASKEMIKSQQSLPGEPSSNLTEILIKKRAFGHTALTQRDNQVRRQQENGCLPAMERGLWGQLPWQHLRLKPPELWENKVLWFKPSLRYFITAAFTD